jgi:hypothetical protein
MHPRTNREIAEIYRRMGFASADAADFFFRKINVAADGAYVPYRGQEDDPREELIRRALSGETFDTTAIYRKLGYSV